MCAVPNVLDDIVIGRIRGKGRRRYDHFLLLKRHSFYPFIICIWTAECDNSWHDFTGLSLCFSFTHSFLYSSAGWSGTSRCTRANQPAETFNFFLLLLRLSFFSLCVTCGAQTLRACCVCLQHRDDRQWRPSLLMPKTLRFSSKMKFQQQRPHYSSYCAPPDPVCVCVPRRSVHHTYTHSVYIPPRRKRRRHSIIILFQSSIAS